MDSQTREKSSVHAKLRFNPNTYSVDFEINLNSRFFPVLHLNGQHSINDKIGSSHAELHGMMHEITSSGMPVEFFSLIDNNYPARFSLFSREKFKALACDGAVK